MEKNSFILYHEYAEHFELLSDAELGQLMRAIMSYESDGVLPDLKGMVKMAFSFIKKDLDLSREKYKAKCERNRQNGQQGGRGNKTEETESENKKAKESEKSERFFSKSKKSERFLEKPKKADNDNDNDNDNDSDNDSDINNITTATAFIFSLYSEQIGDVTSIIANEIKWWLKKVDASLIEYAIEQAVLHNARKWSYIEGILNHHQDIGHNTRADAEEEAAESDWRSVIDDVLLEGFGIENPAV